MTNKVLLVDDDRSILNSMERNLSLDFDVITAESGADGLEEIEQSGPFSVIMSDMRMPGMNGVEFIQNARILAPQATYLMLTGNQDLDTAMQAVNDGQVFRFLNKPCETEAIKQTLCAAQRQYELVAGEKELLHKTFVGAVSALTGVLENSHPELAGIGNGLSHVVAEMCQQVGIDPRWEYKLAARIAPMGFAMVESPPPMANWKQIDPLAAYANEYRQSAAVAAQLIEKIPRLETVASIVAEYPQSQGGFCHLRPKTKNAITSVGASLLRISLQAHFALTQGVSGPEIANELRESLPELPANAFEAAKTLCHDDSLPAREISSHGLKSGMVLQADALANDGSVLMRLGKRLTKATIERLTSCNDHRPIMVTQASFDAFSGQDSV